MVDYVTRGVVRITARGRNVLESKPKKIDVKYLTQFPEFKEFRNRHKENTADEHKEDKYHSQTPEESLQSAYSTLRDELETEVLSQVLVSSPEFFEKLVVELLVKIGYGGSRKDAGQAVGKSGDGGIDGIINEDRLGLDKIYVQAKRWENTVGRPEIQKFAGALQGFRARKGIFITTSSYSREAKDYANTIDSSIVLIDGNQFASYMIDSNVGVAAHETYEVKKIDYDYFIEE